MNSQDQNPSASDAQTMGGRPDGLDDCVAEVVERCYAVRLAAGTDLSEEERKRIQEKQGGHHYLPGKDDGPPMDDTDRNTDKVIKPSTRKP
jgi:hypothetical protein